MEERRKRRGEKGPKQGGGFYTASCYSTDPGYTATHLPTLVQGTGQRYQ